MSPIRMVTSDAGFVLPGPGCVLVIGNFDGVHRGHQAVIAQARDEAKRRELVPAALTFNPHPGAVLGRQEPPLLTTLERRAELLAALGVDCVLVRRFDLSFASWSPERFARELVRDQLRAKVVIVGDNFRFGRDRVGDLAMLATLGKDLGFDAHSHPMAADERGPYSSTRVRQAIQRADLSEAEHVLGRFHAITGDVVKGDQRGRTLGFPTANLGHVPELLPPHGVYAAWAIRMTDAEATRLGPAVVNIGVRPTVDASGTTRVEVHVLDFAGDLYGARLRVQLVAAIRPEQKFASLDALRAQIVADASRAREMLR